MSEPTIPAAVVAGNLATTVTVTFLGVQLGVSPGFLVAGLVGALAGLMLLNTVPSSGDTFAELAKTTWRRLGVVVASAGMAGYMAPLIGRWLGTQTQTEFGAVAAAIGFCAQGVAPIALERVKAWVRPAGKTGEGA